MTKSHFFSEDGDDNHCSPDYDWRGAEYWIDLQQSNALLGVMHYSSWKIWVKKPGHNLEFRILLFVTAVSPYISPGHLQQDDSFPTTL